jgi:splicing factor 3B subunit 3
LAVVDVLESCAPIVDSLVADLCQEGTPQVLGLCGKGPRSSLRVLRHGVKVKNEKKKKIE